MRYRDGDQQREQPGDYRGVQQGTTGKGRNLRELLASERQETEKRQQRAQKLAERIHDSPTRKLMNGVFFVLYLTLFIQLATKLAGIGALLAPVWTALSIGTWPFLWFKPDPPDIMLIGQFPLSKIHLLSLVVYGVVHVILLNVHRAILEERVHVNV